MITIARIKQIVDGLLAYVEYDYETVPEDQTLLYHMFYGIRDGVFDFYEQAKEIFFINIGVGNNAFSATNSLVLK